jgi:hypothetical protein
MTKADFRSSTGSAMISPDVPVPRFGKVPLSRAEYAALSGATPIGPSRLVQHRRRDNVNHIPAHSLLLAAIYSVGCRLKDREAHRPAAADHWVLQRAEVIDYIAALYPTLATRFVVPLVLEPASLIPI